MKTKEEQKSISKADVVSIKQVEVIKIDVVKRQIFKVKISDDLHKGEYLDCERITSVRINEFGDYFIVDDAGLLRDNPIGGFSLGGYIYAGHGLIVGINEDGDTCEPWFNIEMATRVISFLGVDQLPNPNQLRFESFADGSGGQVILKPKRNE